MVLVLDLMVTALVYHQMLQQLMQLMVLLVLTVDLCKALPLLT
jgi:hypothetical protein